MYIKFKTNEILLIIELFKIPKEQKHIFFIQNYIILHIHKWIHTVFSYEDDL